MFSRSGILVNLIPLYTPNLARVIDGKQFRDKYLKNRSIHWNRMCSEPMISRRAFLTSSAALIGAATMPVSSRLGWAAAGDFRVLRATTGEAALMDNNDKKTPIWAYDGSLPGPELRYRRGETARIRLKNDLSDPTSVHWHGIRIDNAMDGVVGLTQDEVPPGGTFDYSFTLPDAGTYWYHPHHKTWEQMARGLYGMLIVEEDQPVAVDRDLLFVADDWRLNQDGLIDEASFGRIMDAAHQGRLGNWLSTNGLPEQRYTARSGERLRMRCVNTANARIMAFNVDRTKIQVHVIALDGQPVPPEELGADGLVLAPAQRADLLLDILAKPGDEIPIMEVSGREPVRAALIKLSDQAPLRAKPPKDPIQLPDNPLPREIDLLDPVELPMVMDGGAMGGLREANFEGQMLDIRSLVRKGKVWSFNGIVGKPLEPLGRITKGRTVVITMQNRTAWPHAMHLHGHHFQAVEKNGVLLKNEPWRDTLLINRSEEIKIAFVADNPGKWLFHCHILEHQAAGMLTWIEIA